MPPEIQCSVDARAGVAIASVVMFDPIHFHAPATVFAPRVRHPVTSPTTQVVLLETQTQHAVARQDRSIVLESSRETAVTRSSSSEVFGPDVDHEVAFRPPG